MDSEILALIDRLEHLLGAGGKLPLSSKIVVPASDAFHLLDQMRQALPREIVQARHIYQERDRILGDAQSEAEALRATARAAREALIDAHDITGEAMRRADDLLRATRAECERLRLEADAYALHSLRDLQIQLAQARVALDATLKTVAGGVDHLESRAMHPADHADPSGAGA
jgi:cell division septum initiation protein DivIVA